MIAVDASPLALGPRRGVARALLTHLRAWAASPPAEDIVLFAPRALPADVPALSGVVTPVRPASSSRGWRKRIRPLLRRAAPRVLYVPWSAFPTTRVPVVVTVHELPFVRWGPIEGRIRTWVHRWWLKRNVRECAAIVTPSEATRDDVLSLHPEAGPRVHVVRHGFDPTPWAAGPDVPRRSERRPRIVAVGTGARGWGPRKKGLDVLRAALERPEVAPADLVVVGPAGDPEWREPTDAALRELLASADCLVHPARSEGFGYPPLEAMAAGMPVVASDGGALPETVGGAAEMVPAGDPVALARGIQRALTDDALRATLTVAGKERAQDFPPAKAALRLLEVLQRVGAGR